MLKKMKVAAALEVIELTSFDQYVVMEHKGTSKK